MIEARSGSLAASDGGNRAVRDSRVGTVTSAKRSKTIRVRFDFSVRHLKYGKYLKRSTTLHAHDETNDAKEGDVVEVRACRRLSKTKTWRLERVIRRA